MEKIREAVEYFKKDYRHFDSEECPEHTRVVLDLAEKVLAVGIGLCLEDTKTIIKRYFDKCGGVINYNEIAKQLHSAQMEKLEGKVGG